MTNPATGSRNSRPAYARCGTKPETPLSDLADLAEVLAAPEPDTDSFYSSWTKLWDISDIDPRRVATLKHMGIENEYQQTVVSPAFTGDGRLLASATDKGRVDVWDISGPSPVKVLYLTGGGNSVATGPNGLLGFSNAAGSAELWSLKGEVRPLSSVSGHNGLVTQVALSPDGKRLATSGADGTTRLWDIESPGDPRLIGVLSGHTKPIHGLAFGPDGHTIATASDDPVVGNRSRAGRGQNLPYRTAPARPGRMAALPPGRALSGLVSIAR